jgi:hypothetical protein
MSKKITKQNITNFLEGNGRLFLQKAGVLTPAVEEQVAYRLLICKDDCVVDGACKKCGCSLPGRAFATESCNSERFPDILEEAEWIKYKTENEIK